MQTAALQNVANSNSDLEILQNLNREYIDGVNKNDARWFDKYLASDFKNTNADGSLLDRTVFLKQIEHGAGVSNIQAHDVIVRVIGDLGIIHARTTFRTPSGKEGNGRYTDIWSRREGHWVCVAAHVSRY